MKRLILGLILIPVFAAVGAAQTAAPVGDPVAGKALWDGNTTSCKNCHAPNASGGFGPDLAGRKLTLAQFEHAVYKPWGIEPRRAIVAEIQGALEANAWHAHHPRG